MIGLRCAPHVNSPKQERAVDTTCPNLQMQHQKQEMRGHPSFGGLPSSKPDVLPLSRKGPLGEMLHTENAKGKSQRQDPARNTEKGKNATTKTPRMEGRGSGGQAT